MGEGHLGASELFPWTSERKAHCRIVLEPAKKKKKTRVRGLKKERRMEREAWTKGFRLERPRLCHTQAT